MPATPPAKLALALALTVVLQAAGPAAAQTVTMQGDTSAFARDPHMHEAWERLKRACAAGCERADAAAYEADMLDIFGRMGPILGMTPEKMRRHVAAIPRQLLGIAREDPAVLTDYRKFVVSILGPD